MTNPDDEIRRHPRTIEQDFEGLFRTMRSKRFRNGEDTGASRRTTSTHTLPNRNWK